MQAWSARTGTGRRPLDGRGTALVTLPACGMANDGRCCLRRRGLAALVFSLSNGMNAFLWIGFSPVAQATARRYDVSLRDVNTLSLLFLYLYAPGYLLAVAVTQRHGLRVSVLLGSFLNLACGWVRYGATALSTAHAFGLLAFGQALGALAQPAFTNAPPALAASWFPPREREHVLVWTSVSNIIGNAVGSAVPGLVVSRAHEAADMDALLLGQAIACTLIFALACAALWSPLPQQLDAPLGDSNTSARDALHAVFSQCGALMRNRNYMALCFAFAVGIGLFNALLTLVAQLLAPCGYGADVASFTGGALLVTGLVGAGLAGMLMARAPPAAVRLEQTLVLLLLAALLGVLLCLRRGALAPLIVTWGALGGALIPLLPVSLENAAAVAHPVSPDAAAGFMLLAGQWAGIVYIYVVPPLLALPRSAHCTTVATPAALFLLLNLLAAVASIASLRYDDRRKVMLTAAPAESQTLEVNELSAR